MLEGLSKRQIRKVCNMDAVASVDNLFLAAAKARRNKRRRPDVEEWWLRRENEINSLRDELLSGTYQPGPYRFFEVRQPKRRMIAAAPFRDRVVHHALCNCLQPVLERHFIARSFSCQKGKGTTAARECCRQMTNRYRYVLKCDVRKFFPNLDHGVIQKRMETYIADPRMLELVATILRSYRTGPELPPPLFPDDDWVLACQRPRGLPIGNLTSQLWGNDYLDAMDHVITEMHGHGGYVRYTDDFLLFDNDKARLWDLFDVVRSELASVRLKLAIPKSRFLATSEGVPFCGFRFLPGLRPRILGATKRRFEARRHFWFRNQTPMDEVSVGVFSWYQFSREANSEGLRRAYVRWPFNPRLRRRRRRTHRVLRGGSWNNNESRNLLSSYRNNNHPDNRNDNNGFRVVLSGSAPKAGTGGMPDGKGLSGQCQAEPA